MTGGIPGRAVLLITILAWLLVLATSEALAQPSEREARARVDALSNDIEALASRLSSTREARSAANRQLEETERALAEIHQRLDTLQAERRQLDEEMVALEQRRHALQAERDAQRDALRAQLGALYRLGRAPQLKLLLNQSDPARLDRLQTYLNYLSRARHQRLEALDRLDEALATNRDALGQRQDRLTSLAEQLQTQRAALAQRMHEREALLADLDARHASEQARMEALHQDHAHAERKLGQVRQALKRLERQPPSTAIAKTQGRLPWPVQGSVVSAFGSGDGVHRNGLVIAATEGTRVRVIHPGRVVFADWMRGFGNLLIVDHGDDIMSLYAHVQRFHAAVGERVERNEVVAAVGNTGGQTQPALYFEVRRAGQPIDPAGWIAKR